MHHLLVTLGSHGDTHPFIGLGLALKQRGHRVTLAANELFGPLIRATGLEFEEVGSAEQFNNAIENPDLWHPIKGFKTVAELGMMPFIKPAFDVIKKHYVPGQTMVSAHGIALGARVAQEVLKIPLATIHLSPCVIRSGTKAPTFPGMGFLRFMPGWYVRMHFKLLDFAMIDRALAPGLNAFRAQFSLAPVKGIIDKYWNSPDGIIALWPDWFGPKQADWPAQIHLTGFPMYDEKGVQELSSELIQFLKQGSPPIAFTFGSAMVHASGQMQTAIDACRLTNHRGLLLTRHRQQVPANLPSNILHVDYVPFSELLPNCTMLVHHGGIGTTSQALRAGIPQIIMPLAHDQHDNAARIMSLGVGDSLVPRKFTPTNLAKSISNLLNNPKTSINCHHIASKFLNTPPLDSVCEQIEKIASNSFAGA